MKVFLTVADGYIGAIMRPRLRLSGYAAGQTDAVLNGRRPVQV